MNNLTLIKKAKSKYRQFGKRKNSKRYRKVIGKFVHARLLQHNQIPPSAAKISIEDAIRAAELEPRILELLPAIICKKPGFFKKPLKLPEDLNEIVNLIRKGKTPPDYRGIKAKQYMQWLERIGHKGKKTSLLKTYRFSLDDITLLNSIKEKTGLPETEIIRQALRKF
jgi:hypothetical protein